MKLLGLWNRLVACFAAQIASCLGLIMASHCFPKRNVLIGWHASDGPWECDSNLKVSLSNSFRVPTSLERVRKQWKSYKVKKKSVYACTKWSLYAVIIRYNFLSCLLPARQNNFPPLPAKCCVQPCFYQDFAVDIPIEFQRIVKTVYYLWLCAYS